MHQKEAGYFASWSDTFSERVQAFRVRFEVFSLSDFLMTRTVLFIYFVDPPPLSAECYRGQSQLSSRSKGLSN